MWFGDLPGAETAEDLNVQSYEGHRALTWWKGRVLAFGFGQGEDLVMNDRYQVIKRLPGGNGLRADLHDFQIRPHGVAYITAFNPIRCDLSSVEGSREGTITDTAIQEIDMNTGLVRWEWHSLDHVAAGESEVEAPQSSTPWDYFHINSIDPQPGGDLVISARSTWAAYRLQSGSGRILWRLGGRRSSFKMGPGTRTAWQHDARLLANGELTLFDDGANPPIHKQSRGLRIALDFATHEARLIASYTHPDPPLLSASQGNMQTLPDGNGLVGYGGLPAITEFAPGGEVLFDAHTPYDMSFYRAFRYPWSALPASPPAVMASENDTGRRDDRARQLERRDGRRLLAGAGRQERRPALDAGHDPGAELRERNDPAREIPLRPGAGARQPGPRARPFEHRQDDRLLRVAVECERREMMPARPLDGAGARYPKRASSPGWTCVCPAVRSSSTCSSRTSMRTSFCRRSLRSRCSQPARPGALAWRSVAFSSWRTGLRSSLYSSGAHPTSRPPGFCKNPPARSGSPR